MEQTVMFSGEIVEVFGPEILAEPKRAPVLLDPAKADVRAEAIARDLRRQGLGRDKERQFRETCWAWVEDYQAILDPLLYELVMDHLTRSDSAQHSLCFAGPIRETMLAEVSAWLARVEQPAARMRWTALMDSQHTQEQSV